MVYAKPIDENRFEILNISIRHSKVQNPIHSSKTSAHNTILIVFHDSSLKRGVYELLPSHKIPVHEEHVEQYVYLQKYLSQTQNLTAAFRFFLTVLTNCLVSRSFSMGCLPVRGATVVFWLVL